MYYTHEFTLKGLEEDNFKELLSEKSEEVKTNIFNLL
jgi:hypothetical protein